MPLTFFPGEEIVKPVCSTKTTTAIGSDSLPSVLLRHGTTAPTDVFTSAINSALSSSPIPDCGRPVTIIPIPKSSYSAAFTEKFSPHFPEAFSS